MRRTLPRSVLAILIAYLSGCGEAPNRPSVITDRPVNPPKTNARYIQVPWDISLFFNIPGGAVVAGATTAATVGGAAEGDNLTGAYSNSTGFGGTLTGVLTGTLENGTFNGSLKTITASGCPAERQFTGPVTTGTINWSPGTHVNDCGGTSPLTGQIQVTAAASAPPPCTSYSATIGESSFAAAGGSSTVTVTAGTGCIWFATSSAGFVTLSASQGTGNGSVQVTVAANTTTSTRTATVVVANQSFTITQAGVPAPVCTYALNDTERTFEAAGALGGVDMRTASGCAWTAQSDAPWLTFTSGSAGNGNGAINFAVAANTGLGQRVGRITAQGQVFTVTQNGVSCTYTVTPPAATAFPAQGGTGTATVATQASCAWSATSNVPWVTITPPPGGTGNGSVTFTVASNPDAVARTGVLTVASREITLTQAAAACVYTVTPSTTTIPAGGGPATVAVVTQSTCAWTAVVAPAAPWITVTSGASGTGSGTVSLAFAANTTGAARPGTVTVAGQPVTFTQATNIGSLTGLITNSFNGQPVQGATVAAGTGAAAPVTTTSDAAGRYTFPSVPQGTYTVDVQRQGFVAARGTVTVTAGQAATFNAALAPRPVALTITWTPNPTSVDPEQPICDASENYCWQSTVTIQETSGNAATIASWVVHFYFPDGSPDTEATETHTGAEFAEQFGANPIAGLATVSSERQLTRPDSRGGTFEYVFTGTDPYGRAFTFTSPRLVLNPVIFSEGFFSGSRRPAGARATDRPARQPGRRP